MSQYSAVVTKLVALLQNVTFDALKNGGFTTWVTGPQDPSDPTIPARLRLFADVPKNEQPACFLVTHREIDEYKHLGVYRVRCEFLIYIYSDSTQFSAMVDLDSMLVAVRNTINAPDNFSNNSNTLAKLVEFVRVEGRVFKDPGDIDRQALMIITVVCEMP